MCPQGDTKHNWIRKQGIPDEAQPEKGQWEAPLRTWTQEEWRKMWKDRDKEATLRDVLATVLLL